jgi:ferredoxin
MLHLSEANLRRWLEQLLKSRSVIAPVKGPNGLVLFKAISKAEDAVLDFDNTAVSPKDAFFPPSEAIFTVRRQDGGPGLAPATVAGETVLFAIHPGDAQGIALVDKPYLAEPADLLYKAKREKTTLVGLACTRACPECFCTAMGSGPQDGRAVDLLLYPVAGGYAVKEVTPRGKALLGLAPGEEKTVSLPAPPAVPVMSSAGVSDAFRKAFNDAYWDQLADRCLHCNVCAYVCPTCYCFDVRDYPGKGGTVERVRTWDSCQSPGWTRAAGGHNPRPGKGARLRQRFAHKLLYFPEVFGALKCTGCGRCVKNCPVNIDIREIIRDVRKLGGAL